MAVTQAPKTDRKAPWPIAFYQSSVGKKWVMALTGVVLVGYVVAHMIGNLHLYQGADHMNEYGAFLRTIGEPILPRTGLLWILRTGLLAAFILHLHAAYALTRVNHAARPMGYQGGQEYMMKNDYPVLSYASRTMRYSGVIVLLFIAWHLADLTLGVAVEPNGFLEGMPYENVVASFSRWGVAALYIVANLLLGLHLRHGVWSMFQSLGANNPTFNKWRHYLATAIAAAIVIGNLSFPIAVLTGVVA